MQVLHLMRKEKENADVVKIHDKNKSPICETVKKEKEILAGFGVTPLIAKVAATVDDNNLVEVEKALHLYSKIFWELETTFT